MRTKDVRGGWERTGGVPHHKAIAKLNRYAVNPLARMFAGRIPPFAVVEHIGRRTGKNYRTPIMAFPTEKEMIVVIALTYGSNTD